MSTSTHQEKKTLKNHENENVLPCLLGWWGNSLEVNEESKLLLTAQMRSVGIGTPNTMYLKIRSWCSSSCHCDAMKRDLFLALILIYLQSSSARIGTPDTMYFCRVHRLQDLLCMDKTNGSDDTTTSSLSLSLSLSLLTLLSLIIHLVLLHFVTIRNDIFTFSLIFCITNCNNVAIPNMAMLSNIACRAHQCLHDAQLQDLRKSTTVYQRKKYKP